MGRGETVLSTHPRLWLPMTAGPWSTASPTTQQYMAGACCCRGYWPEITQKKELWVVLRHREPLFLRKGRHGMESEGRKVKKGWQRETRVLKKKYREEGPCFYAFHLQILTTCQTPSLNCTRIPTSQRWSTQVLKSQRPQTVFTTRKSSTTRKTGQQYTYCLLLHKYLSIANCYFLISRLNWKTL